MPWTFTNYSMIPNNGNYTDTGVARTLGWHKFVIYLHTNGTDFDLSIDDVVIYSGSIVNGFNGQTDFSLISYDNNQALPSGYFDDIAVFDAIPGGNNFTVNDVVRCEVVPTSTFTTGDMVFHEEIVGGLPSIGSFAFNYDGALSGEKLIGHLLILTYVFNDPQMRTGNFVHTWKVNGEVVHIDDASGATGATMTAHLEPMYFNYGDVITVDIDGTAGLDVLPTTTLTIRVENNEAVRGGGLSFTVVTDKRS